MKLDTFFDNFGLLADAPNGVQKLREMILQLAVQGKLIPQDPKDEPASVLLEKIKAEKKRLIKKGTLKKGKLLPTILVDEIPYELPKGWEWEHLGNVQRFVNGFAFKSKDYEDSGIGIVRIGDIVNGEISESNMKYVAPSLAEQLDESLYVSKGDLLIAMSGATTGKLGFNLKEKQFLLNQRVGKLELIKVDKKYTFFYLSTKIKEHLRISAGSAIPNLSTQQINNILFPLPPLREQKRIVAKVDELMALCDELEARKQQVSINCIQLNDASIHKLLTTREPKKFGKHWQRICDNFDLLYSKPENGNKLHQAILQLAVQGKLVPQDPKDEPASVLLEKIKAEKERLIKEKKIKKPKPLPPIEADEIPFELPFNWVWARLDIICSYIQRGKGPKYIDASDIPVISQKCIQWDGFKIERARFVDPSSIEKYAEERFLQTGDLLWNSTGTGTIGRVNVYSHEENHYELVVADSHVTVVRPKKINSRYIYIFLASPVVQFGFEERASGTTNQIELNTTTVKNQIIAVPPLPEQKRIVAKVDELIALCDELETSLSKSQTDCNKLMEAAVAEILAA